MNDDIFKPLKNYRADLDSLYGKFRKKFESIASEYFKTRSELYKDVDTEPLESMIAKRKELLDEDLKRRSELAKMFVRKEAQIKQKHLEQIVKFVNEHPEESAEIIIERIIGEADHDSAVQDYLDGNIDNPGIINELRSMGMA